MLKIAVVEDQQEVRDELCRFIRQYAAENSLQVEVDRKSTRLNSSHNRESRMPSSA